MSVPSEPQIYVAPGVFNQAIEFYWQPPISDGGSNITSYILESANIGYISVLPPTRRKARVANLINQTDYLFTLKATNDFGNSNIVSFRSVQPGFPPDLPSNINVLIDLANSEPLLNLTLTQPDTTNSSNITYNALTMYPLDSTGNIIENSPFMFKRFSLPGLFEPVTLNDINSDYEYKGLVQSINDVRWSKNITYYDFKINPNLPTNNLKLWLDPYDLTTLTLSNNKVIKWNDKSINQSNATISETFAPTYDTSNIMLSFNGTQYMNLPANTIPSANTAYSMFIYASISNINLSNLWLLYSGTPSANLSLGAKFNNGNIIQSWFGSDLTGNLANFTVTADLPILSSFTYDGNIRRTYVNGTLITSETIRNRNSGTSNNIIGSLSTLNANLIGSIGSIVLYDRLLTDKERTSLETYLIKKRSNLSLKNYGNLTLWLDATDNNTLYNSNINEKISYHNPVSVWLDKSNNNNHAFQSNTSIAPLKKSSLGIDSLNFNSGYMISNIATLPFDAFLIVQLNNLNNVNDILGISPVANNYNSLSYNVTANRWSNDSTSNIFVSSNVETSGNFLLMEYSLANNNAFIRRNGSNIANITNFVWSLPNNSKLYIGNDNGTTFNNSLKGNIGEIIMFNKQLNNNERFPVEGYLAWKWGIQNSLPSSHLFKNNPPSLFNILSSVSQSGNVKPTDVSGLTFWLDADDSTTLTLSNSNVLQWNDKSGSGLNAIAPVSSSNSIVSSGSYNYFVLFVYGGYGKVGLKNLTFYGSSGPLTPQTYTVANVTSHSQLTQIASTDNFYKGNGSTLLTKRVSTASPIGSTFTNTTPGFPINNSGDSNFLDFLPFYISTPITPNYVSFGCYDPISGSGDGLYRCKYFRLYGGISTDGAMPNYLFNMAQYGNPNSVEADIRGYATFAQIPITAPISPIPTYITNILNSKPVVNFTASQFLQTPTLNPSSTFTANGTDTTIFLITRLIGDGVNNLTSFGLDTTDNNFVLRAPWSNGNKILDIGARLDFNYNLNNQIVLFSMGRSGSNMFLYNNGSLIGSIANAPLSSNVTTQTQKLLIGSGLANSYNGYIAEFLIYKTALSILDRQKVEGYLAWKWGLQSILPYNHPYKISPSSPSSSSVLFTPSNISGLSLWIDASILSYTDNTTLTSWASTGGLNQTFTGNMSLRTGVLNGLNVVQISSSQYMSNTGISLANYSFFMVTRQTGGSNGRVFQAGPINSLWGYWGSYKTIWHSDGSWVNSRTITSDTQWDIYRFTHDSNNYAGFFRYGTSILSSSTVRIYGGIQQLHINKGVYPDEKSDCQIAEVVIYNTKISDLDLQRVEGYLAWKWGLQNNLDIAHPYRNAPPYISGGANYLSGFIVRVYDMGYYADNVSWFLTRTPSYTFNGITNMTNIDTATNGNRPVDANDYYSVQWTGYFYCKVSGNHTFWMSSDDASYFWIGSTAITGYSTSNPLINNAGIHGMATISGSISLTAGIYYPIRMQFGENGGGDDMQVSFIEPGGSRTYNFSGYAFNQGTSNFT